ncbi:hypothetical protein [Lysinibacillus sp. fls2-241-R2A-57]|nr:hypothetical protein [Lysinibacillus sp. fls2-241-R2A-57]
MFSVAKAKRQLQSPQSERKSTTRYGDELSKWKNIKFLDSIARIIIV